MPSPTWGDHVDEHEPSPPGETVGHEFELRITLTRNGSDTSLGPSVRGLGAARTAHPPVTEVIEALFLLAPEPFRQDGYVTADDVRNKLARIKTLCQSKTVAVFTRGAEA